MGRRCSRDYRRHVDLKLVSRLEFGSGAVAMRHEPEGIHRENAAIRRSVALPSCDASIVATSALAVSGPTPGIVASSATAGWVAGVSWRKLGSARTASPSAERRAPRAEFSAR